MRAVSPLAPSMAPSNVTVTFASRLTVAPEEGLIETIFGAAPVMKVHRTGASGLPDRSVTPSRAAV